jgi:hypothetical protein
LPPQPSIRHSPFISVLPSFLSFSSHFPPPQAEHDSAKVAFEEEKKRRPTPSKVAELVRSSDLSSERSSGGGPAG